MKKLITLAIALMFISSIFSCAKQSGSVAPSYVSGSKYSAYTCEQLSRELEVIDARLGVETKKQDDAAAKDAALVAFAVVIFPVSLFWLGGDTPNELARMKGEAEALRTELRLRGCN